MLGDFSARVLSVEDDAAIVDLGDAVWPGDEDTHITQHIFSCDPTEIANQLNAFWLPIWRKFSDGRLTTKNFQTCSLSPSTFRCILPFRLT